MLKLRRGLSLLATLPLVFLLSACAGQIGGSGGSLLDTIKSRGKLICGVSGQLPGFSYVKPNGEYAGLDVDVCRAIRLAASALCAIARLATMGIPSEKILHVAGSIYHDIVPANSLGLSTVWVNRRLGQDGSGAALPAQGKPDLEVPDLKSLAAKINF